MQEFKVALMNNSLKGKKGMLVRRKQGQWGQDTKQKNNAGLKKKKKGLIFFYYFSKTTKNMLLNFFNI